MSVIIHNHKTQGEWKIQLIVAINFVSSKESDETSTIPTKSDNIEIMRGNEANEIIEELFTSLWQRSQEDLEESMKGSEFVFDSVDLLYYKLHKISVNRSGTYVDSPKLLENKKATINPKNNDKRFQYVVTVELNLNKLKVTTQKEYPTLNSLLINIIGKIWTFQHLKKIEKSLN